MKYLTNTGDTFDSIAYELLGNEEYMTDIIAANPKHAETVRFDFGVELEIPAADTVSEAVALPSWRRT